LLTGLSIVGTGTVPGLWIVVTDLDPEPTPTPAGETETPTIGHAVALALTPAATVASLTLELQPEAVANGAAPVRVADLGEFLQAASGASWTRAIEGIGRWTIKATQPAVNAFAGPRHPVFGANYSGSEEVCR